MTSWWNTATYSMRGRKIRSALFRSSCAALTWLSMLILAVLLFYLVHKGWNRLDWQLVTSPPSANPDEAGIFTSLVGSLWMIIITAVLAIPVGVAAAVYLEEYARKSRLGAFIEINISNLAGVPSIVYGILGLALFVRAFQMGRSVLAGACTMALLVLPVVIIASREAIRAVPGSLRQASYALGATRWQTVLHHVLPAALPGILTGVILAISRAIGEAAPLIMIGAFVFIRLAPSGPLDEFAALPILIYNWASRPSVAFHELAAAAILVLLATLFLMNAGAIWLRHRTQRDVG